MTKKKGTPCVPGSRASGISAAFSLRLLAGPTGNPNRSCCNLAGPAGSVREMTDAAVSPRTSYLFARSRALHGIARVVDFFGVYDSYNTSPTPQEADISAVFQDWLAVEEDAKHVMGAHSASGRE